MKLKASVDYGVRTVIYLAVKGGTCSSREISEEMSVPRDYLIQLALRLRNAGVIKAKPGKNGGYLLAKKAQDITIGQILDAFDTDLKHVRQPMKKGSKASASAEAVREMHAIVTDCLEHYLSAVSVQDIIDAQVADDGGDTVLATALEVEAARLRARAAKNK